MVRMKMLNLYKAENVPDHLVHEIHELITDIFKALEPVIENVNSNMTISAMNHVMAIMVKLYISEDPKEIKKAALTLAKGFLGNVKFYTEVDVLDDSQ